MNYYVTGDTHNCIDIEKLFYQNILTKNDYLIIAGDAGFLWNGNDSEKRFIQDLHDILPFTILFVDGNHENFDLLYDYPLINFKGGLAREINDKLYHLSRGQIFTFNNKKVFTFGGAHSTDKMYRTEFISWWRQEIPSWEEEQDGLSQLERNHNKVDYIITHAAPYSSLLKISRNNYSINEDSVVNYLDEIKSTVKYDKWFCGHYHIDTVLEEDKLYFLYDKIIKLC